MKIAAALATFVMLLGVCAGARAAVIIEQAAAGSAYDFAVHVKNVPDYGYNPEVASDRAHMALRLLRGQCRRAQVVGQRTIDTEIYGLITGKPDYVVFVRCV